MTNFEEIQWDFSEHYSGTEDPKIRDGLSNALSIAKNFLEKYKGKMSSSDLSSQTLKEAIESIEEIQEKTYPIVMYSRLLTSKDSQNSDYKQLVSSVQEKSTEIFNYLIFFELELNELDDEIFDKLIQEETLSNYVHYLNDVRKNKPYQLSETEEQMIILKNQYGKDAFQRLYGELTASWVYEMELDGEMKEMTGPEIRSLRMHPEPEVRRTAMKTFFKKYEENSLTLVNIFNNLFKDYFVENRKRKYPSPITRRNMSNEIKDETVKVLEKATTASYPKLVHRYYNLKKKIIGLEELTLADIYAPLPQVARKYDWDETLDLILKAFEGFDPEFREIVQRMVDEKRIDAPPMPGKRGGAFCAGATPHEYPWVFMNHTGNIRDVFTLAHELGHAIHSVLGMKQTIMNFNISLVTAEIASVFGEMILSDYIMKNVEMSKEEKIAMLSGNIEDNFATSHRQNMFHRFELIAHELITEKIMTAEEYCDMYEGELKRMFGDSVTIPEEYRWEWASIPHFLQVYFYVYAYNMSNLLVIALYALYLERGESFIPQFKKLLATRCALTPEEMLSEIGADINDPAFWDRGLEYLEKNLDQLEELLNE
ncbi:MAG: M3 family oligoendopeptidase [Candidatus Kariarchaeaceae archaeon]